MTMVPSESAKEESELGESEARDVDSSFDPLISRAKAGDVDAFSSLMEELQPRLLAQAVAFCSDPQLARDLVQETMVAAWKSMARFDGSCKLFTWLYVILLRQHKRAKGWFSRRIPLATEAQILAAPKHESSTEAHGGGIPGQDGLGGDESELLRGMVSSLSQKHQEVVRLRFYSGASESEMAAALGISPGTVKSRLHHALEKLRRMKEKLNPLQEAAH